MCPERQEVRVGFEHNGPLIVLFVRKKVRLASNGADHVAALLVAAQIGAGRVNNCIAANWADKGFDGCHGDMHLMGDEVDHVGENAMIVGVKRDMTKA